MDASSLVLANVTIFGESVTYLKGGTVERAITAIVDRNPPAPLQEAMDALRPRCILTVANSNTTEIASSEIDTGTDLVSVAVRSGGTAENLRVARILDHTADWLQVECY